MTYEVYRKPSGNYAWRIRDEDGKVVPMPRPGGFALPPDPERERRSLLAVQEALRQQYEAQQAAKG